MLAWFLFFIYRKIYIEREWLWYEHLWENPTLYIGLIAIPACWTILYYIQGVYHNPFRRSRINEMLQTLYTTAIGVLVLFFVLLLDDEVISYKNYYKTIGTLFGLHFFLTAIPRFVLSSRTNKKIQKRKIGFKTLLIGSNEKAWSIYNEIQSQEKGNGNLFIGFVHIDERNGFSEKLKQQLPHIGELNELPAIIKKQEAEELIIALESSEHAYIQQILNSIVDVDVHIKLIPDVYDILAGSVKSTALVQAPLMELNREVAPRWQLNAKRIFDVLFSLFVLLTFSWLYLLLALLVKWTSKGPVIFSQERLGLHGQPFKIYKFRSMYVDAEKMGPALSSENDPRITTIGLFLRKSRLDEFPQFFNVLVGTMSIVGPRPERKFYVEQIIPKAPYYRHLHRVRPGITSWGQVKYGYAQNVDEMIKRLKYDLLYTENISLLVDVKIILYTIMIVFQGRGK
ncbi:MAG: sugar transferase [Bacteroidetes bacterium]|nr:sugar transferase [Bacteroidota bacterium]